MDTATDVTVVDLAGLLPLGLGLITPASTPALRSFTLCCLAVVLSESDLEPSLKMVGGGGDGTSVLRCSEE